MRQQSSKVTPTYPETSNLVLGIFATYIVFWWLEIGLRRPFFLQIRIEFLLGAVLGAVCLFAWMKKGKVKHSSSPVARWALIYLFVMALTVPFSLNSAVAWDFYVNRIFKLSLMAFFISQLVTSPKALNVFLLASFFAFLKIGQESFLGTINGSMIWENQGIPRLHGIYGTMFGSPNSLSGKTVSVLPFVWYLWPTITNRFVKIAVLVFVVFAINIVLFTGSRTGYLSIIVISVIVVMLSEKRARMAGLFVLLAIVAVMYIPEEYKERFLSSFTGQEAEGASSDLRVQLFQDSLTVFSENPLGVGIGNFPLAQRMAGRHAADTHNLYTQLLAEVGVPGFVCFVALIVAILLRASVLRRRCLALADRIRLSSIAEKFSQQRITRDIALILGTANALLVFVFARLVLGIFGHDMLEIYWWIAAGLALALSQLLRVAESKADLVFDQADNN